MDASKGPPRMSRSFAAVAEHTFKAHAKERTEDKTDWGTKDHILVLPEDWGDTGSTAVNKRNQSDNSKQ